MSIDTNAVLKGALRRMNVEIEKDDVNLHGLLPKQLEAKHRGDKAEYLLEQIPQLAPSIKQFENGEVAIKGDTGSLLFDALTERLPNPLSFAYKATKFTLECNWFNIREGEEIRHALVRASAYGASMELCKEALPEQFIKDRTEDFYNSKLLSANNGRTDMLYGTTRVLRNLTSREDADEIRAAFLSACRDGQRAALEGGASHPSELLALLQRRPETHKRYIEDPAFRVGFDSARWALERGRADEIRESLNIIERPISTYAG